MSMEPKTIVVIDDSDLSREIVSRALSAAGYRVVTLDSAVGSTQVIFREEPDLVLLDVNMPTLSGERLAAILRGNRRLNKCRIILYSGQSQEELEKVVRACGADGFVSKSTGTEGLLSQIERSLARPVSAPPADGRGRGKVLVVDDSPIALQAVKLSLEPAGFAVIATPNVKEVAELVLREKPDVVLIDMNMPDLPGVDLAELVKKVCSTPGTRVLLHSSESLRTLEEAAGACGADGYVTKTSDPEMLVRQIEKWLS